MQKNQFLFLLSLIFAVIVCVFALTNAAPVTINLFFYKFEGSLALVIFLSAMLGAIILALLGVARFIKFRMEIKKLGKEKDTLIKEKELLIKQNEDLKSKNEELMNPPIVKQEEDPITKEDISKEEIS